jgi:hypothetical protein
MSDASGLNGRDLEILRRLAGRKMEIAQDPVNLKKRERWYAFDEEKPSSPMVLLETGGIQPPVVPDGDLTCEDPWARGLERALRTDMFQFEQVRDDSVVDAAWYVGWHIRKSGYGVETVQHRPDNEGRLGARRWDPPLKDLDREFDRLQKQTFSVDRDATMAHKARLEAIFGGIMPVSIRSPLWWTLGMTIVAIDLIGLENLMLYMYDNPDGLKRLMQFLCDDHLAYAKWAEKEGLLSLNNANDYIGSGSRGFTRRLPAKDWKPGMPVRTRDQWVLLESQETVGVGPELFDEFIFPYQLRIAKEFGLCYYGCCEPVHTRIHILKQLPNLGRISVSPWANEEAMARECGTSIVYSRKPNPALISTSTFDEDGIRRDIRKTLQAARGCRVELVMKDVHTLSQEPDRAGRWVALARDEIRRAGLD